MASRRKFASLYSQDAVSNVGLNQYIGLVIHELELELVAMLGATVLLASAGWPAELEGGARSLELLRPAPRGPALLLRIFC
jgi:hypothetical protein